MNIIQIPCSKTYFLVDYKKLVPHGFCKVILTSISEKEEMQLDKGFNLILKRDDKTFKVIPSNVYCYGVVDFHTSSDDFKQLNKFNILFSVGYAGKTIPANYNYETHTCLSEFKSRMITETFKPAVYLQYAHGCINKPERVVLFKYEDNGK